MNVCTTPCETSRSVSMIDSGNKMYNVERVRSTQKLPIIVVCRRTNPRINATSTAMPAAAETKFCMVRPTICVKYDSVVSPP